MIKITKKQFFDIKKQITGNNEYKRTNFVNLDAIDLFKKDIEWFKEKYQTKKYYFLFETLTNNITLCRIFDSFYEIENFLEQEESLDCFRVTEI